MQFSIYIRYNFILLALLLSVCSIVRAQDDEEERARERAATFNAQKQGVLVRTCDGQIYREDYNRPLSCQEWFIVWRTPAGKEWGRVTGKTRASVERQRDKDIAFMKQYARFFNTEFDPNYSNPGPPTCDACDGNQQSSRRNRIQDQILHNAETLYDKWESKLEGMRDQLVVNEVWKRVTTNNLKTLGAGRVLLDYIGALRDAQQRLRELKERLDESERIAFGVTSSLDIATRELRISTSRMETLYAKLSPEEIALLEGREPPEPQPVTVPSRVTATRRTTSPELQRALYSAVDEHDVNRVRELLAQGADPNDTTSLSEPPLARAAGSFGQENLQIATMLLEKGACINTVYDTKFQTTPFWQAIYAQSMEIINLMLQNGADLNGRNSRGQRPSEAMNACADNYTSGGINCGKIAQMIARAPSRPVQVCGQRSTTVNSAPTPGPTGLPYTVSPSIEPPNPAQEEEERARERTRLFNEQKKKEKECRGCAPSAEAGTPKKRPK